MEKIGEYRPSFKKSICLNCTIDVSKCDGRAKCYLKQKKLKEAQKNGQNKEM